MSNSNPHSAEVAAGFFASSYTLSDGSTVISYRGTDSILGGEDGGGSDLLNGWTVGAGYSDASQAAMAEQFYTTVTGQSVFAGAAPPNLILTGHSLGGGLAGFIATLTGAQAAVFDNMPFGVTGGYGDMIRIALFVGRINEEGIGVVQIGDCVSCPRNWSP